MKMRSDDHISSRISNFIDKSPTLVELETHEYMRNLHKNLRQAPYDLKKGDYVCIVKAKPSIFKRKKFKNRLWKVDYVDSSNGVCQLNNFSEYDKLRADRNLSFIRSHNFSITDIWDLAGAFTLFFLPRLKVYIEFKRYGFPVGIDEKEWENKLRILYDGLTLLYEGEDAHFVRTKIVKEHPNINKDDIYKIEFQLEKDAVEIFKQYFN